MFKQRRQISRISEILPTPNLIEIQRRAYQQFLQPDVEPQKRLNVGLEALFRETFPVESYDKKVRLEYLYYTLGRQRYDVDQCRKLNLTYGRPLRARFRLIKPDETVEEDVYLGDVPIMIGGGEFIINGSERVIVNQIHRSPGIDFSEERSATDKALFSCRILPERGSWIEMVANRYDWIELRIDRSQKMPATLLLRAMLNPDDPHKGSPPFDTDADIIRAFHPTEIVKLSSKDYRQKLLGKAFVCFTLPDETPEEQRKAAEESLAAVKTGDVITPDMIDLFSQAGADAVEVISEPEGKLDRLILNTIEEEHRIGVRSHNDALLELYKRLRPGNPPRLDKAKELFHDKFYSSNRYRVGKVGRFRINRKFRHNLPPDEMRLMPQDFLESLKYFLKLRRGEGEVDDIDHLGNRQVRTLCDLACEEIRKGFLKLKRTAQERLSIMEKAEMRPSMVINTKTVSSAIEYFFARSELSQVVDQTNPLSQLTHERRLSALGPGGLNRKRAGFEVRDVHISHYGRVCPIETPEGTNIGLINSLALHATLDEYGFLITPYRRVVNGSVRQTFDLTNKKEREKLVNSNKTHHFRLFRDVISPKTKDVLFEAGTLVDKKVMETLRKNGTEKIDVVEIVYLHADEEEGKVIAPGDTPTDEDGTLLGLPGAKGAHTGNILARVDGSFKYVDAKEVDFIDVSPRQLVGVSANLIPFLEHNDVSRALMGSNMQRQAVPLVKPEPPLVATGIERDVARNSGMVIVAQQDGVVSYVDAKKIVIKDKRGRQHTYNIRKFEALNEKTCLNQKPCVKEGQSVKKGEVIADGAATCNGELSLGRNVLVAFMPWEGYNFEDAIIVSERLVKEGLFLSIHLNEFEVEVRETKLGREEFTRDIPNVPERMLANLDENGIVRIGTKVRAGDILVGKVVPKSKTELTPEEKLLKAIFGRAGEDVKNDSLEVPSGVEGIVVDTRKFSRKHHLPKEQRAKDKKEVDELRQRYSDSIRSEIENLFNEISEKLGVEMPPSKREEVIELDNITEARPADIKEAFHPDNLDIPPKHREVYNEIVNQYLRRIEHCYEERDREVTRLLRGDELPAGVLERVTVTIATLRNLSVGDKIAGRHGNKGVIAKILPEEDMPYLEDGTPVDMILNPLGVPSRMNIGQIFETHLAWACKRLGIQAISPIFDGYSEEDIREMLKEAGLPEDGRVTLYDGRTGEPFKQKVTVGYLYMMKLHHLVDDKIHARATGPYSLITQQPLGGKARYGGQRFGEMEVWALEAYGAANTLQEILTVKSDDVDGRNRVYEAMTKGENWLEPGTPVSFEVLINELKGLCLNIELRKTKPELDF